MSSRRSGRGEHSTLRSPRRGPFEDGCGAFPHGYLATRGTGAPERLCREIHSSGAALTSARDGPRLGADFTLQRNPPKPPSPACAPRPSPSVNWTTVICPLPRAHSMQHCRDADCCKGTSNRKRSSTPATANAIHRSRGPFAGRAQPSGTTERLHGWRLHLSVRSWGTALDRSSRR